MKYPPPLAFHSSRLQKQQLAGWESWIPLVQTLSPGRGKPPATELWRLTKAKGFCSEVTLGLQQQQLVGSFPGLQVGVTEGERRSRREWKGRELEGGSGSREGPAKPDLQHSPPKSQGLSILRVSSPPHLNISQSHLQPNPWKDYVNRPPSLWGSSRAPTAFRKGVPPLPISWENEALSLGFKVWTCISRLSVISSSLGPLSSLAGQWKKLALTGAVLGVCCVADSCWAFCLQELFQSSEWT